MTGDTLRAPPPEGWSHLSERVRRYRDEYAPAHKPGWTGEHKEFLRRDGCRAIRRDGKAAWYWVVLLPDGLEMEHPTQDVPITFGTARTAMLACNKSHPAKADV